MAKSKRCIQWRINCRINKFSSRTNKRFNVGVNTIPQPFLQYNLNNFFNIISTISIHCRKYESPLLGYDDRWLHLHNFHNIREKCGDSLTLLFRGGFENMLIINHFNHTQSSIEKTIAVEFYIVAKNIENCIFNRCRRVLLHCGQILENNSKNIQKSTFVYLNHSGALSIGTIGFIPGTSASSKQGWASKIRSQSHFSSFIEWHH